jgi:hypothetical protein
VKLVNATTPPANVRPYPIDAAAPG